MNGLATAARRARALAGALTAITVIPEQRDARNALVVSLRTVALALAALPAPPADGPMYPPAVCDELDRAISLLGPISGVPAHVMTYVIEPLTGRAPELPALESSSPGLALQELRIKDRIAVVRRLLDSDHESILRAAFLSLVAIHRQFLDLGAAVALDEWQPCHQ